jgi:predicted secreted protein
MMEDETLEEENTYKTTDFYTTAVLISQKFEVKEISTQGPNDKVKKFHFEDTPELREIIMKYMNGTLEGNLREFRNAIETVKDAVHSG